MGVYTKKYDTIVDRLISECAIYPAFDIDTTKVLPKGFKTLKAVWDTGADTTCIHPRIVNWVLNHTDRWRLKAMVA